MRVTRNIVFVITLGAASVAAQIAGAFRPEQVDRADQAAASPDQAIAIEMPLEIVAAQAFEMGDVRTGHPFMADVSTERIQTLSDGNRIVRRGGGKIYRDSQGRTRREQEITGIGSLISARGAKFVLINDPIEEVGVVIDERARHARRTPLIRVSAAPTAAPDVGRHGSADSSGPAAGLFVRSEDLGEKLVNGVWARGTKTIATLAPGAIGNERPVIVTTVQWMAIELNVLVSSQTHDPRFGETRYELTNVSLSEPPRGLFSVPPGYTLDDDVDVSSRLGVGVHR